jgi:hypothetical protein
LELRGAHVPPPAPTPITPSSHLPSSSSSEAPPPPAVPDHHASSQQQQRSNNLGGDPSSSSSQQHSQPQEKWQALLASLRESIDWVLRKDSELSSIAHVLADIPSLHRQQVRRHFATVLQDSNENLNFFFFSS